MGKIRHIPALKIFKNSSIHAESGDNRGSLVPFFQDFFGDVAATCEHAEDQHIIAPYRERHANAAFVADDALRKSGFPE
jgi:hypothetical protein